MNRERAFTLLEVLVAVALLGVVVVVLAQSAIQGMAYEGDAARRLRASLLADRALWEIEAGLKLGVAPQPVHEERAEGDDYRLTLDVQPIDLATAFQALLEPPSDDAPTPTPPAGAPAIPLPLFQVLVRVAWTEGLSEREVTRTTFAFDASAAALALGATGENGAPAPPQEPE